MINWQEKLNSDTFVSGPVPHFRIYDVLPRDLHDMFYNSYMGIVRDKILQEDLGNGTLHIWARHKPQPLTSEWLMLLNTLCTGGPEVVDIWNSFSHDNLIIPKPADHVRFNHWNAEDTVPGGPPGTIVPGGLLDNWHRDGEDSKLVCIYYLGTGEETQGNFELMNENTKEMVDYEYKANSMTIMHNRSPQIHRFRQTGLGQDRRTLYTGWIDNRYKTA